MNLGVFPYFRPETKVGHLTIYDRAHRSDDAAFQLGVYKQFLNARIVSIQVVNDLA